MAFRAEAPIGWKRTFMEISTRKVLPDQLKWLKVSGFAWANAGFFYSRYPAPETGHELYGKNEFHSVYFHRRARLRGGSTGL